MTTSYLLYCALCWQEFDHPSEHDAGSIQHSYDGPLRLNGHCPGDIRRQEPTANLRIRREEPPSLPDAGEPIDL